MFQTFKIAICFGLAMGAALAQAQTSSVPSPKYYIGIAPAEDRWVTLPTGAVYQGVEISYLLGQKLFDSGKFIPVLINPPPLATPVPLPTPTVFSPGLPHPKLQSQDMSLSSSQDAAQERQSQIPAEWTTWLNSATPLSQNQGSVQSHIMVESPAPTAPGSFQSALYSIKITPVVEKLLYSSGARSDRAVYGFSPDHINPFNVGRAGAFDNAYTATLAQIQTCQKADFFNGQMDPNGYGPFSSNFGSNFDEGVTFDLFGQGVAFILKTFQVADQIRFLIDDTQSGAHQELVFNTTAKGTDVYVWASYKNISGSIDIQTRTTMIAALQNLLPQVVDDLIGQRFSGPWQSTITSTSGGIIMGAGANQNVQQGLEVASPNGDIFQVATVTVNTANLVQVAGNYEPVVGDPLQAYVGQPLTWATPTPVPAPVAVVANTSGANGPRVLASSVAAPAASDANASGDVQTFTSQKSIVMDQTTRATQQVAAVAACVDHQPGMIEQALDSLFIPYGFYRYAEVFDQAAKPPTASVQNVGALRVAIIDSGIDVKDSTIKNHLAFTSNNVYQGFDFISWDPRPSDDNGHGTAAAKLLLSLVKKPIVLLSAKVIGSQGETSSSAIYDGFNFAISSQVDAIVIPWSSISSTLEAYIFGAQLAASANIPVFVAPGTVPAQTNIYVGSTGAKSFKTSGLDATVKLSPEGVSTIQALANWINSKK